MSNEILDEIIDDLTPDKYYLLKIVITILISIPAVTVIVKYGDYLPKYLVKWHGIAFLLVSIYSVFSSIFSWLLINGKPNWHPFKIVSCLFVLSSSVFILNYVIQKYLHWYSASDALTYLKININTAVFSSLIKNTFVIIANAIFFGINGAMISNVVLHKIRKENIRYPILFLVIMWMLAAITLQYLMATDWYK